MKIHKVYPPFYNGISEQINELSNDTYCRDMINCVPDIVKGINKANGEIISPEEIIESFMEVVKCPVK